MRYEVIDPQGIHLDGKRFEKGEVIPLPDGPALDAFMHFKQVTPIDEADGPALDAKPEENPKQTEKPKR